MAQSKEAPTPVQAESDLYFGPFRLEQAKRLWRGEHLVEVRPRPLAVLRYLAERPSRLVTGDELIKRLWPGIYVTRTVLRVCVRELRQALDEDPVTPQFIETVIRQGYRFIAPLTTAPPVLSSQVSVVSSDQEEPKSAQLGTENWQLVTPFVGRERELARLHAAFARTQRGARQVIFLTGELGIGKTTVMNRFLAQVRASGPVLIGRGQCIEHYGPGEAYLPLLEALGQLGEGPSGEQVITVLRRSAPMWLGQLSGLLEAGEREAIHRQLQGSGRERMVRELAEALEAVATDAVLVLVMIEILGWIFQREAHISPVVIAKIVLISVLAPLLVGLVVRRFAPALAERMAPLVARLGTVLLIAGLLPILVSAWPGITSLIGNGTILAITAVVGAGLVAGHVLGGPDPDNRTALAIASSMRHPGVALAIANANFPGEKLVFAAVLLFALVNAVVTIPYVNWSKRRHAEVADGVTAVH